MQNLSFDKKSQVELFFIVLIGIELHLIICTKRQDGGLLPMLKYKSRDIKLKPIFIINGGMRIISNYALKGFFIINGGLKKR